MYVHGFNQYAEEQVEPSENLTWLDYIIISNPQGVMKVLAGYGHVGYLAPRDSDEMIQACMDLLDRHGDQAVIDLLKSNPLYDLISEMSKEETKITVPFRNASGGESLITKTITSINFKLLAENVLIVLGAFYIAGKVWEYITKKL